MEKEKLDLLNMDQEDDNLLGVSPTELGSLGVSPLSPSVMPKVLERSGAEDLENCYGKLAVPLKSRLCSFVDRCVSSMGK